MKELSDAFLLWIGCSGAVFTAAALLLWVTLPSVVAPLTAAANRGVRNSILSLFVTLSFVGVLIVRGGSKNDSQTNGPQTLMLMALEEDAEELVAGDVTEERMMTATGVEECDSELRLSRIEKWWRRGAWNDGCILNFEDGWLFPWGTNRLDRVEIWSNGKVYPSLKDDTPFAELATPLALKPEESEVYCGPTPDDTYLIKWKSGHPNRDTELTADASIELFRNGEAVVIEDGATNSVPRMIPFPHVGFGQNEDWVRANFTNADEITAVGYDNWAEDQIGIGLTNGLYMLTASFLNDPVDPTLLTVGECSVCVTNAGEYVFVLEKGREYAFNVWPYDDSVDYWLQDDMAPGAQLIAFEAGGWNSSGEWTVDGGDCWLFYPVPGMNGWCRWMPTLQGSPDVSHLGADDFPKEFKAVLTDYCGSEEPIFQWTASDDNIRFESPNSQATSVSVDSMPSWKDFTISVQANLGGYALWSHLYATYGINAAPQVTLSLKAPEVVFLNDDNRTSRWYKVSVGMSCEVATNVMLDISHSGLTDPRFASDSIGENTIELSSIELTNSLADSAPTYSFYMACSNIGNGIFTASCETADGNCLIKEVSYDVIEPLQKLVCNDHAPNGGYYNPSVLVYGTNSWLKVGANGTYNAADIHWRIVSGPGRIIARNDDNWSVCVEPTASEGEVVIEAAFGDDSPVQPRFVLPIVSKRRVSVFACMASSADDEDYVDGQFIEQIMATANNVYRQSGVEFYLDEPVTVLSNTQFSVINEHNVRTNALGGISYYGVHPDVTNLISHVTSYAEVKIFVVDRIVAGSPLAFTLVDRKSCIIAKSSVSSNAVVPHELGHALGLKDIYNRRKKNKMDLLPNGNLPLCKDVFSDASRDWGSSDGRGFYERVDTHSRTIESFLMNGFDNGGCDIPYSSVEGYAASARNVFDTSKIKIGTSNLNGG